MRYSIRLIGEILPLLLFVGSSIAAPFLVMIPEKRDASQAGVELLPLEGKSAKYSSSAGTGVAAAVTVAVPEPLIAPCRKNFLFGGLHCCSSLDRQLSGHGCKPITKDPWKIGDVCPKGKQGTDWTYACCDGSPTTIGACWPWVDSQHLHDQN